MKPIVFAGAFVLGLLCLCSTSQAAQGGAIIAASPPLVMTGTQYAEFRPLKRAGRVLGVVRRTAGSALHAAGARLSRPAARIARVRLRGC